MTVRLAVLVSGGGTMLQNFLDRIADGSLDASVEVVVSSNSTAYALERAKGAGIETHVVRRRDFETQEAFSEGVTGVLEAYDFHLIALAGYTQRYIFPAQYEGRVLNIHGALLPKFGGQGMWRHHVHEAVLASGDIESGCTVHIADHEYDHGPILLQKKVPVLADDTAETLEARVHEAEIAAYPEAIRLLAQRLGL